MSHYIAEIVIPPGRDVRQSVEQIMEYFRETEYDDDGNEKPEKGDAVWWDFWVIGGRFSGHKLESSIEPAAMERFHAALEERKVTVSGLTCGRQTLEPASQIPMVDALWREMCPGKGEQCFLFRHARDQYRKDGIYPDDVCTVADLPDRLSCDRLIVAGEHWGDPSKLEPKWMKAKEFWNQVTWQKTDFDGLVKPALMDLLAKKGVENGGLPRTAPLAPDWWVVTVDYHN